MSNISTSVSVALEIRKEADRLGLRGFERARFVGAELKRREAQAQA